MYAVERLSSYISRGVYTVSGPFHPFGGAVDIIVVEQPDGTFKSSPWYVRFGKFQGVLKTKEKVVDVSVNGVETGVRMYLDHKGEAYFLKEVDGEEASDSLYPSSSGDEADEQSHSNRLMEKSQSFHFSANEGKLVKHNGLVNGKTLGRTNPQSCDFGSSGKIINRSDSRQSRILSPVSGRRSVTEDRVGEEEGKGSVGRESSLEHAELAAELMDMKWSTALATRKSKRDKTSKFSSMGMTGGESQVNNGSKYESDHSQLCNEDGSLCDSGSEKSRCSGEENVGASSISSSNCEEEAYAHASTAHSSRESCILLSDTCSNNLHVFRDGDGDGDADNFIEDAQIIRNHIMDATGNGVISVSDSLVDSVEELMLEVMHQDTSINQMVAENINLKVGEVQVAENHFRHENASQMADSSSLISVEDSHDLKLDFCMEKAKGISPSEGSVRENIMDHADVQMTDTSSCYSPTKEKLPAPDNPLNDSDESIENPRLTSNPISIPRIHKDVSDAAAHLVKSLPNLWSNTESQDSFHPGHRLCCSLDSNSRSFNSMLWRKNSFNSMNNSCVVDKECQSTQDQQTDEGNQISAQLQNNTVKPIIEISLCKHLLYEGMGREAASRAFDSEKLDVNKFASVGHDVIKNDRLVVKIDIHYLPWEAAAPIILEMVSFGSEKFIEPKGIIAVDQVEKTFESSSSEAIITGSGSWRIWPFSFKRSRTDSPLQQTPSVSKASDLENASEGSVGMDRDKCISKTNVTRMKMRTVTPASEQMASLNLKEGRNTVTFTFSTAVLGKQQVDARIYLWKWNTHIVISDVDGTITKSDVLGQFMPLVGFDWSQTGVAHLFSSIKENGYQLLFLSARAISQAYHTRQFLCNLKQDGKVLPEGPVVISPDGLFPSLFREVIRRAPHEFKIACLEDIKALFPSVCNPFYAGFGNRDTDEISYLKVGIPKGKIFIINPKGEVAVNRRVDTKSYKSLHALVNDMFPPISSSEQEDYNSWNFWRLPAPAVEG